MEEEEEGEGRNEEGQAKRSEGQDAGGGKDERTEIMSSKIHCY